MNNVAGIDIGKGKSVVSVLRPCGEVIAKAYSVHHTGIELKKLDLFGNPGEDQREVV